MIDNLLIKYWHIIIPIVAPLLIAQFFKDPVINFCLGLKFYLSKMFNELDHVIINGEEAIIVKIGITRTIFRIIERNTYLCITNDRLKFQKLEIKEKRYEKI